VAVDHQLALCGQNRQDFGFQVNVCFGVHQVQRAAFKKHEAAVDPVGKLRPFDEASDEAGLGGFDDAVLQFDLNGRYRRQLPMRPVEGHQLGQVYVAHVVAIGHEEAFAGRVGAGAGDAAGPSAALIETADVCLLCNAGFGV
jgi:hypothetical protein